MAQWSILQNDLILAIGPTGFANGASKASKRELALRQVLAKPGLSDRDQRLAVELIEANAMGNWGGSEMTVFSRLVAGSRK